MAAVLATGVAFWAFGGQDAGDRVGATAVQSPRFADPQGRWLRTDAGIAAVPGADRPGGAVVPDGGLSPTLIAAMLKAESGFNPHLSDTIEGEYGIARWTPSVLVRWQPGGMNNPEPHPSQNTPELSIPAMGRFLCYWGKDLTGVPGDPALNLAAAYRSSAGTVRKEGGVPDRHKPYTEKVRQNIEAFRPR